jgi:hypothetical protein
MNADQEFFIRQSVALARSLPVKDAVRFLSGFCLSCPDKQISGSVRKILIVLSESDRQLVLIETGQIPLPLN